MRRADPFVKKKLNKFKTVEATKNRGPLRSRGLHFFPIEGLV
jgi:hypothetical protein